MIQWEVCMQKKVNKVRIIILRVCLQPPPSFLRHQLPRLPSGCRLCLPEYSRFSFFSRKSNKIIYELSKNMDTKAIRCWALRFMSDSRDSTVISGRLKMATLMASHSFSTSRNCDVSWTIVLRSGQKEVRIFFKLTSFRMTSRARLAYGLAWSLSRFTSTSLNYRNWSQSLRLGANPTLGFG